MQFTAGVPEKSSKKTKPLGAGTVNLTANVPVAMQQELLALAKRSDMKMGEYCRALYNDAISRQRVFQKNPPTDISENRTQ